MFTRRHEDMAHPIGNQFLHFSIDRFLAAAASGVSFFSIAMARTTTALVCLAAAFGVASAQVATLTASNFETEVVNGGKNAFVKFYAPWCASR